MFLSTFFANILAKITLFRHFGTFVKFSDRFQTFEGFLNTFYYTSKCYYLRIFSKKQLTIHISCDIMSTHLAELCKGSTADSDSVCLGSNPSSAAKNKRPLTPSGLLFLNAEQSNPASYLQSKCELGA